MMDDEAIREGKSLKPAKSEKEERKQEKRRKKKLAALKDRKANKSDATPSEDPHFNVKDSRFAALFSDHQFALDPTDPRWDTRSFCSAIQAQRALSF